MCVCQHSLCVCVLFVFSGAHMIIPHVLQLMHSHNFINNHDDDNIICSYELCMPWSSVHNNWGETKFSATPITIVQDILHDLISRCSKNKFFFFNLFSVTVLVYQERMSC